MKEGYARSEESKAKWEALSARWSALMEKDSNWKRAADAFKVELKKVVDGMKNDEHLGRVRAAHARLGDDLERGLVEAGREMDISLQAMVNKATWFWQDLFKVYLPRFLSKVESLPIPRYMIRHAYFLSILD